MGVKKPEIPSRQVTLYDKSHDIYTFIPFDVMTLMGNETFDNMATRRAQVSTKPEKLMFSRQMLWEAIIHPEDKVKLSNLDGDEVINLFSDWVLTEDDGN
jgi:hypothetical protein